MLGVTMPIWSKTFGRVWLAVLKTCCTSSKETCRKCKRYTAINIFKYHPPTLPDRFHLLNLQNAMALQRGHVFGLRIGTTALPCLLSKSHWKVWISAPTKARLLCVHVDVGQPVLRPLTLTLEELQNVHPLSTRSATQLHSLYPSVRQQSGENVGLYVRARTCAVHWTHGNNRMTLTILFEKEKT